MAGRGGRGIAAGGVLRALLRLALFIALGFGLGLAFGLATEEPELLARHLRGESESVALLPTAPAPASESDLEPAAETNAPIDAGDATLGKVAPESVDMPATVASAPRVEERPRPRAEAGASASLPVVSAQRAPESARTPEIPPNRVAAREAARSLAPAALAPAPRAVSTARRAGSASGWAIQVGAFSEESAAAQLAEGLSARYPVDVLPATAQDRKWRVRVQPLADEAEARAMADRLKRDEGLPTWVTRMAGATGQ